jgi:hypothetical protein
MRTPLKLKGASEEKRVQYAVERFMSSKNFDPSKNYKIMVREKHEFPSNMPTGDGLLKMDDHWEKVKPIRDFHLPRQRDTHSRRTCIEDIQSKRQFVNWFEKKFEELPSGVYGILQSQGKGNGNIPMFVLQLEDGKIVDWKKRSNNQSGAGVGEKATLLGFPYYFQTLRRAGIRDD